MFDCFFSYQHEDLEMVEILVNKLESKGLKCWYAPRNINGRYAKAIAEGINHCKVFLLILNHRSAISEEVLNEVELAHNVAKQTHYAVMQPILTEQLDFDLPDYGEMMYHVRRIQFVNAIGNADYDKLVDDIINSQPQLIKNATQRVSSQYVVQDIEDERLKIQNVLLDNFDNDVYERVFTSYNAPTIMDVGCGTGKMMLHKVADREISCYLGIDKSKRQVNRAINLNYGIENVHFHEVDVESGNFTSEICILMEKLDVSSFDIINVSMLLLHIKKPDKLLSALNKCLSDQGTLIIRDIDDGLNFAYPDPENAFERIYKICEYDEQSGNRRNGRQIFYDLKKAGFKDIKLERQGLSSIGMNEFEKESFFQMYFPFIRENCKIMSEKYPKNKEYKEDSVWYDANFSDIHNLFLQPDFIFSLGFMTYTAKK